MRNDAIDIIRLISRLCGTVGPWCQLPAGLGLPGTLGEVFDLDAAPTGVEVFGDQAAVAAVRLMLAAQQAAAVQKRARDRLCHPPLAHQVQEPRLVGVPIDAFLAVVAEQGLSGCEAWQVDVVDAAELIQEPGQVVLLGETG